MRGAGAGAAGRDGSRFTELPRSTPAPTLGETESNATCQAAAAGSLGRAWPRETGALCGLGTREATGAGEGACAEKGDATQWMQWTPGTRRICAEGVEAASKQRGDDLPRGFDKGSRSRVLQPSAAGPFRLSALRTPSVSPIPSPLPEQGFECGCDFPSPFPVMSAERLLDPLPVSRRCLIDTRRLLGIYSRIKHVGSNGVKP